MSKFTYKAGNFVVVSLDRDSLEPLWIREIFKVFTEDDKRCIRNFAVHWYDTKKKNAERTATFYKVNAFSSVKRPRSLKNEKDTKSNTIACSAPQHSWTDSIATDTVLVTLAV